MGWSDWVPSAQGRLSYLQSLIKFRGWAFLSASGGICHSVLPCHPACWGGGVRRAGARPHFLGLASGP